MNIPKIIELQSLFLTYNKAQAEFNNSEISKKYAVVKQKRDNKKQEKQKCEEEINNCVNQINKLLESVDPTLLSVQEVAATDYNGLDEAELVDEKNILSKCESEVRDLIGKIDNAKNFAIEANRKAAKIDEEMAAINAVREPLKQAYDAAAEQAKVQLTEIVAKIKKLKEEMAESDYKLYEEVCKTCGKYNAFVSLKHGAYCGGCGMEIERGALDSILSDGHGSCPNCRRIVYKEN